MIQIKLLYAAIDRLFAMDMTTLVIGGLLLTLLAYFATRLGYTVLQNLFKGRRFHQRLEKHFDRLRLSQMLTALGIDKSQYIHRSRVQDINRHMSLCEACEHTERCDERLNTQKDIGTDEIDYCANADTLKQLEKAFPSR